MFLLISESLEGVQTTALFGVWLTQGSLIALGWLFFFQKKGGR